MPLNPKTNPYPNPNPNQGSIFLGRNCLVAPNSKTNPNLDPNLNLNRGQFSAGGSCPDAYEERRVSVLSMPCLLETENNSMNREQYSKWSASSNQSLKIVFFKQKFVFLFLELPEVFYKKGALKIL